MEEVNELMFRSEVRSLHGVLDKRFMIPSYQRPYVWGEEQINKMLSDFHGAYLRDDSHYFIGTVITASNKETDEVIDGQQRFTTLWLIAVSFKLLGVDSDIVAFLKRGGDLRFDFAIRKQLKAYLTSLCERTRYDASQYTDSDVENDEYLVNVARALVTIANKLGTLTFDNGKTVAAFGNYIYKHIQFVVNHAPQGTNLNKLFSTINNSGIQLEQSDILKSRLLFLISKDSGSQNEVLTYGKIWEACENMSNYFERNIRSVFPETKWLQLESGSFSKFDAAIFKFRSDNDRLQPILSTGILLSDLLQETIAIDDFTGEPVQEVSFSDDDNAEIVYCRSIINFPQLLLHAYRIHLYKTGQQDFQYPFHIKYLIDIFRTLENKGAGAIKDFIYCLWEARYALDRFVVKWIRKDEDKDEELKISTVYKNDQNNTRYFQRTQQEGRSQEAMLQSVLYFTGNYNTQIWLTPYLKRIIDGEDAKGCLEQIDNDLSVSLEEDKLASWRLMDSGYRVVNGLDVTEYLNEPNGTGFRHYWFQKLEYILWKNWPTKSDPKFVGYKITSKNSVEHVFPQNHEWGKKFSENSLDSFGNLALLNVSQNSSYSNQDPEKKRVDFKHKDPYDSLKLYYIYLAKEMKEWDEDDIIEHQNNMIELINEHYNQTR